MMYYLVGYVFANLGAFALLSRWSGAARPTISSAIIAA